MIPAQRITFVQACLILGPLSGFKCYLNFGDPDGSRWAVNLQLLIPTREKRTNKVLAEDVCITIPFIKICSGVRRASRYSLSVLNHLQLFLLTGCIQAHDHYYKTLMYIHRHTSKFHRPHYLETEMVHLKCSGNCPHANRVER